MTEMLQRRGRQPVPDRAPIGGRADNVAVLPLSFAQERMCFCEEFSHGLPAQHVPGVVWLRGPLDVAALCRAADGLVARHEALRTRLTAGRGGQRAQVIDPPATVGLELTDYAGLGREAGRGQVRELADKEAVQLFDLAHEWPFRMNLVRLAADEHALVIVVHRTAFDDWSFGVLLRDLAALYRAAAGGVPSGLAEPLVRFADYAIWERERLQGPVLARLEDYWCGALGGVETSQFPTDRPRPLVASHDGVVESIQADRALLDGLRDVSRREGTTLLVTLMAALQVLLSRYTGQSDVVIGTDGTNRADAELADLVGSVASTLPVRADLSGDPAFTELLGRVRAATESARAHQDLPFARLAEVLQLDHDVSRFPVFQVGLSCAEPASDIEAAGVVFHAERVPLRGAMYDIDFIAEPRPDGLALAATYVPELFDPATIQRLLGNWEVLLRGVAADPSARLSQLPVLTQQELHAELVEWNDTAAQFPPLCIHEGFEAQVARAPGAVAAQFEDEQLSYAELNASANRIARRLRSSGVGPEVLVGVCMQTGLRRLTALLGIWKAGGGYVPLDPGLPAERLSFMIADTGMSVLLTDEASAASVPAAGGVSVISLDADWEQISGLDGSDLTDAGADRSNVAYVIYTSGSTGEPKGVVVEHRQAINFLQGMVKHWRIGPGGAVLQFAAFTFDVSVADMFMALLGGAKLVLAPPETLHSPPRLAALIRQAQVTFACLPPTVLNLLTGEDFPSLRTLLSAGAELTSDLLRAWLRDGLEIYNGYGPTEASMGATFMLLDAGTQLPPPIGRPKPNYRVYVLDSYLNPVPVGVIGELHVGGPGVARGYLNRPELTAERFISDPFAPGQRLYKTGDLVRRRADGTIMFVGRADDQVKIRGLRVELGEIQAALAAHPAVAQAEVIVVTDQAGEKQLAAYLRAGQTAAPQVADILQHLAAVLPAYMIPTYVTMVEAFPLTTNGKIDKAALPAPQTISGDASRVPPSTLIEAILVDLYATVLGHEQVGAADSFFEVGGNSVQAMQLITKLRATLDVDLDVAAVFLAPAPQQLAALLRDTHGFDDADLGAEGTEGLPEVFDDQTATVLSPSNSG
jgi:amino acid adenylation domain-containing protein